MKHFPAPTKHDYTPKLEKMTGEELPGSIPRSAMIRRVDPPAVNARDRPFGAYGISVRDWIAAGRQLI